MLCLTTAVAWLLFSLSVITTVPFPLRLPRERKRELTPYGGLGSLCQSLSQAHAKGNEPKLQHLQLRCTRKNCNSNDYTYCWCNSLWTLGHSLFGFSIFRVSRSPLHYSLHPKKRLVSKVYNALRKVDLGVCCDKGHGSWYPVLCYRMADRLTQERGWEDYKENWME